MKTLSEFLVDYIFDCRDYTDDSWKKMIKDFDEGIEAYKKYLQNDSPNTVHWSMVEQDLITALERMQNQDNLKGLR